MFVALERAPNKFFHTTPRTSRRWPKRLRPGAWEESR